ncbi:MAG: ribonuclease P protein component [Mariniphaga sp.]|jgi:ribonuclease P protein component|nr:ribonuclease P protein component [Mariniphaga sp.]
MNKNSENSTVPDFSFKKAERLCSKKQIEKLFSEGNSFLFYPLKVVYADVDFSQPYPAKAAFTVSKKLFKTAVRRNLIKRRMREAYRLNKQLLVNEVISAKKIIFFIYIAKEILDFQTIEKAMKRSLAVLAKSTTPNP